MNDLEFFQFLFEAGVQIKQLHHVTEADPAHRALGDFYDRWDELMDTYIETYQGRYGRVYGNYAIASTSDADCELYLLTVRAQIENRAKETLTVDSDLLNLLADMRQIINHTLYRLTLKK